MSSLSASFWVSWLSAVKNFLITGRRSPRNMCSVLHNPIPSAPASALSVASSRVSAFARTPIRLCRAWSHQSKSVVSSEGVSASEMCIFPAWTSPVVPLIEISDPSLIVTPPMSIDDSVTFSSAMPHTAGNPKPLE